MKITSLILTLCIFVPSFSQAAECESYARELIATAFRQSATTDVKLEKVEALQVQNEATAKNEAVERLSFSYGDGTSIVVETLPSYYSAGTCELKDLKIGRE